MRTIAVLPCFNEADRIATVVKNVLQYVDIAIVVNDGSEDATTTNARAAGAHVIEHLQNCGAGAATMTGIEAARLLHPTYIVLIDGDGQHDPADIPKLIQAQKHHEADIVFTNRFAARNHIPFIRRLYNAIGNMLTFLSTGSLIPDSQSGFKLLAGKAIKEIDLQLSGYEFCTEIVYEAKTNYWKIAQCPISVTYSEYTLAKGQSFAGGVKTAIKILLHSLMR